MAVKAGPIDRFMRWLYPLWTDDPMSLPEEPDWDNPHLAMIPRWRSARARRAGWQLWKP